jgi:hypothetical protein
VVVTNVVQVPLAQLAVPSTKPVCVETNVTDAGRKPAGTGGFASSGLVVGDGDGVGVADSGTDDGDDTDGDTDTPDDETAETPGAEGESLVATCLLLLHEVAPAQVASATRAVASLVVRGLIGPTSIGAVVAAAA